MNKENWDRSVLLSTKGMFPDLGDPKTGKVRDIYEDEESDTLLIICTDRISALDRILNQGVADKGRTLNLISASEFLHNGDIVPNHLITIRFEELPPVWQDRVRPHLAKLDGRFMLVEQYPKISVEAVVRSYMAGSLWKEYNRRGGSEKHDDYYVMVWGILFPCGLKENEKLSSPVFTPTTKADEGHDKPITMHVLNEMIGEDRALEMKEICLKLYERGQKNVDEYGLIFADTKYEFGWDTVNGDDWTLVLIDEMNTPDSSRYWIRNSYNENFEAGLPQQSYDKQVVRDWLAEAMKDDPEGTVPDMPEELIIDTTKRYRSLLFAITGISLE